MNKISVKISESTLSIDNAYQTILDDSCGGNCLFIGTVRNRNKGEAVTHLDFETYDAMAEKEMTKIAEQCLEKFDITKVAIHHRKGHVGIKDIAVIIAVSSGHRDAAFQACRFAIDTLKDTVPIWKKEHLEDGSYWVGARP
ncbi:MAG: molybdopterin synthase catalytic subunit [Saprospiraceae bacterium]|jgi:molybdopterin synthase catalytic subunit|tara:strand:- start:2518 stop:2940 length:423 start_codon:yes stop_codon:yes gene_type:complete